MALAHHNPSSGVPKDMLSRRAHYEKLTASSIKAILTAHGVTGLWGARDKATLVDRLLEFEDNPRMSAMRGARINDLRVVLWTKFRTSPIGASPKGQKDNALSILAAHQDTFHSFLKLPFELREMIYNELLIDVRETAPLTTIDTTRKVCYPAILQASKKVYDGAVEVLYRNNHVHLTVFVDRHAADSAAYEPKVLLQHRIALVGHMTTMQESYQTVQNWPVPWRHVTTLKISIWFRDHLPHHIDPPREQTAYPQVFFRGLSAFVQGLAKLSQVDIGVRLGGGVYSLKDAKEIGYILHPLGLLTGSATTNISMAWPTEFTQGDAAGYLELFANFMARLSTDKQLVHNTFEQNRLLWRESWVLALTHDWWVSLLRDSGFDKTIYWQEGMKFNCKRITALRHALDRLQDAKDTTEREFHQTRIVLQSELDVVDASTFEADTRVAASCIWAVLPEYERYKVDFLQFWWNYYFKLRQEREAYWQKNALWGGQDAPVTLKEKCSRIKVD